MPRKAEGAFEKESEYEQKVAARMLPLRDARMVAEDAVWRSVLDAYAIGRAQGRRIPALEEAFSFFGDKLGGRPTDGHAAGHYRVVGLDHQTGVRHQ